MDDVVAGTVVRWSDEEGWGVLRSDGVGTVFAHFSMIRDQPGYRCLTAGRPVWFRWERPGQDGCDVRAIDVWSAGPPTTDAVPEPVEPVEQNDGAYRSWLTITWDDPPGGSPPPRP